jgi:uncharacterized glyoxalase superfamily protein PhnB
MWQHTAMTNFAKNCTSTVIPGLRYRDALKMIDWLEQAFGFKRQVVFMAGETAVAHAQLTFGNGMIMLGSVDNGSEGGRYMVQPDEVGNKETKNSYLVVSDCDAIYASAKAAGAEMILDLRTMDYGGKAFTCRDPEGHIWSIGEYDPWQPE